MQKTLKSHGTWIGKWTFVLAATGSAVGWAIYGDFHIKQAQKGACIRSNIFIVHCFNWTADNVE